MRPGAVPNSKTRYMPLLLASLASTLLEVVRLDASPLPALDAGLSLLNGAVVLGLAMLVRRAREKRAEQTACLILALALPLITEAVLRQGWDYGQPNEMALMLVIRNLTLFLSLLAWSPRCLHFAVCLSLFMMLFGFTKQFNAATSLLTLAFMLLGIVWLFASSWDRLAGRFADATKPAVPRRALGLAGMFLTAVVATVGLTFGRTAVTTAIDGIAPTSGGTEKHDPFARDGVGDGDLMLAAKERADAFGAVESELMLSSHHPSLYDMFDETYGEPVKKKSEGERAVALAPQENQPREQHLASTQQAGREFDAVRRGETRKRTLQDRSSPAIMYVEGGGAPLHLALERYNQFDGRVWTFEVAPGHRDRLAPPALQRINNRPWIRPRLEMKGRFLGTESARAVKIIALDTARIPGPPLLTGVHIDQVDRADMFEMTRDEMLAMRRATIPPLTVLHVSSRKLRYDDLRAADLFSLGGPGRHTSLRMADTSQAAAIRRLAAEWTRHEPPGWRRVEAIVDNLRKAYTLDRSVTAPKDCEDVAVHFLFESRRGPDYFFATAAAALLRSAGFPTRLVSGFYANPDRYDRVAGLTKVVPEDVHFWVEVWMGGDAWIPVEPTPGYFPTGYRPSWIARVATGCRMVAAWIFGHPGYVLLGCFATWLAFLLRKRLADGALTMWWWLALPGSSARRLAATLSLIECRARLAGIGRPSGMPLRQYYRLLCEQGGNELLAAMDDLLDLAEPHLYAPKNAAARSQPIRNRTVLRVCFRSRRAWNLGMLRQLAKRRTRHSDQTAAHAAVLPPEAGRHTQRTRQPIEGIIA